jgi:prepilin peptidase CpaA
LTEGFTTAALVTALAAFVGCAGSDLLYRRIPNLAVAAIIGAFVVYGGAAGLPAAAWGGHLAVAGGAFAVTAGCFAAGWLGGGDVKLATAALLWAGPGLAPLVLVATGAIGIVVALVGYLIQRLERTRTVPPSGPVAALSARRGVPYGVGLSVGGLLVILPRL